MSTGRSIVALIFVGVALHSVHAGVDLPNDSGSVPPTLDSWEADASVKLGLKGNKSFPCHMIGVRQSVSHTIKGDYREVPYNRVVTVPSEGNGNEYTEYVIKQNYDGTAYYKTCAPSVESQARFDIFYLPKLTPSSCKQTTASVDAAEKTWTCETPTLRQDYTYGFSSDDSSLRLVKVVSIAKDKPTLEWDIESIEPSTSKDVSMPDVCWKNPFLSAFKKFSYTFDFESNVKLVGGNKKTWPKSGRGHWLVRGTMTGVVDGDKNSVHAERITEIKNLDNDVSDWTSVDVGYMFNGKNTTMYDVKKNQCKVIKTWAIMDNMQHAVADPFFYPSHRVFGTDGCQPKGVTDDDVTMHCVWPYLNRVADFVVDKATMVPKNIALQYNIPYGSLMTTRSYKVTNYRNTFDDSMMRFFTDLSSTCQPWE